MNNKEKQQGILKKISLWKLKLRDSQDLTHRELKCNCRLSDYKYKAKLHKEEIKEQLGNLKCVFKNDQERVECAKIIKLYEEEGI